MLGQVIQQRRSALGYTLRHLAKKSEVSAAFLCRIENGESSPSLKTLERIAGALDVKLSTLLVELEKSA